MHSCLEKKKEVKILERNYKKKVILGEKMMAFGSQTYL
jgi:hypothetical protein